MGGDLITAVDRLRVALGPRPDRGVTRAVAELLECAGQPAAALAVRRLAPVDGPVLDVCPSTPPPWDVEEGE